MAFDGTSLFELRSTLAAHADRLGATADDIECILIVGTELPTNVIRHGGGAGQLRLWRTEKTFTALSATTDRA